MANNQGAPVLPAEISAAAARAETDRYKRYARSFHRDVLVVRGLAQRGKLSMGPPPSYPSPSSLPVLNFLARLGDNGVVWHILGYWRATD